MNKKNPNTASTSEIDAPPPDSPDAAAQIQELFKEADALVDGEGELEGGDDSRAPAVGGDEGEIDPGYAAEGEAEGEAPAPAAAAPAKFDPDAWVIPADDTRFPERFRGQPMSKYRESWDQKERFIEQAGRERNEANDKARVLEALLANLPKVLAAQQGGAAALTPTKPHEPDDPLAGVDVERELTYNPTELLRKVIAIAQDGSAKTLSPKHQELVEQLQAVQAKIDGNDEESAKKAVRSAAESARIALSVPEEEWKDAVMNDYLPHRAGSLGDPRDPETWKTAYSKLAERRKPAAAAPAATRASLPSVGTTSGTPPGATRTVPLGSVGSTPSHLRPRVRQLVRDSIDVAGSIKELELSKESLAELAHIMETDLSAMETPGTRR